MKILLDENFPLALLRRLREEGHHVDHIILLGLRGAPRSVATFFGWKSELPAIDKSGLEAGRRNDPMDTRSCGF
ncbi:MAG: DUF5615 family PIN-like protein [Candidatus Binataceae bacterium]